MIVKDCRAKKIGQVGYVTIMKTITPPIYIIYTTAFIMMPNNLHINQSQSTIHCILYSIDDALYTRH